VFVRSELDELKQDFKILRKKPVMVQAAMIPVLIDDLLVVLDLVVDKIERLENGC
jgi:hypothetical protein